MVLLTADKISIASPISYCCFTQNSEYNQTFKSGSHGCRFCFLYDLFSPILKV